jgi:hypothetical protein
MFKRMKPAHRLEAFRLFQAIYQVQQVEGRIPSALRLSFMDRNQPYEAITAPLKILTTEDLQERLSIFEARLRSRCCGLFEVQYFFRITSKDTTELIHIQEGRVNYLHRTVSDFLNSQEVRRVIEEGTAEIQPEIHERLISSVLYSFKTWRFYRIKKPAEWKEFLLEVAALFVYCQESEADISPKQVGYIQEIDDKLVQFWRIRAMETRSKASGNALGDYEGHWSSSFFNYLNTAQTVDSVDALEDPLAALESRYNLQAYTRQRLAECVGLEGVEKHNILNLSNAGKNLALIATQGQQRPRYPNPAEAKAGRNSWSNMASISAPNANKMTLSPAQNRKNPDPVLQRSQVDNSSKGSSARLSTARSNVDQSCFRCKSIGELTNLGFKANEILQAMQKAGVGTDVPAITNWILHKKHEASKQVPTQPSLSAVSRLATSELVEITIPRPVLPVSKESIERQWSVVPSPKKPSKIPTKKTTVVGAEPIAEPPKKSKQKSKSKRNRNQADSIDQTINNQQLEVSTGVVQVKKGQFTWIFEANSQDSLTPEQIRRLEESIKAIGL